jgi:hypothetical protein
MGTTGAEGATTGSKDDSEVNAGVESSQIQQPPRIQVVIPRYKPSDQEAPSPTRIISPPPPPREVSSRRISEMANLAVAMELYLGDHNAFRAREEVKEQIPIPKTYQEVVSDPTYGAKWKEAIQLKLSTLIQFGTWRYVQRPKDQAVVSTK